MKKHRLFARSEEQPWLLSLFLALSRQDLVQSREGLLQRIVIRAIVLKVEADQDASFGKAHSLEGLRHLVQAFNLILRLNMENDQRSCQLFRAARLAQIDQCRPSALFHVLVGVQPVELAQSLIVLELIVDFVFQ